MQMKRKNCESTELRFTKDSFEVFLTWCLFLCAFFFMLEFLLMISLQWKTRRTMCIQLRVYVYVLYIHGNHSWYRNFLLLLKTTELWKYEQIFWAKVFHLQIRTQTHSIRNVYYPSYKCFFWKVNLQNVITFLQHFIVAYFVATQQKTKGTENREKRRSTKQMRNNMEQMTSREREIEAVEKTHESARYRFITF